MNSTISTSDTHILDSIGLVISIIFLTVFMIVISLIAMYLFRLKTKVVDNKNSNRENMNADL